MEEPGNKPTRYRSVVLEVETAGVARVVSLAPTEELKHFHSVVLGVPDTVSDDNVQIAFNYHRPELGPDESKDWRELEPFLPAHRRHRN